MCLCLVRRSGSTIAVRRRSHSSNRRVALTMFIWMVGHNSAGLTGCQWGRDRRVSPDAQLGRCHHEIAESSRSCVFLSSSQTKSAPAMPSHNIACSTGVLQGPIQQWRKFRASYAVGKIDVEFAAGDPQFLGIGFDPEKRFPSVRGWICGEEGDEKFARIEVTARRKRVPVYYISQVRRSAKNHAGAKTEAAFDLVLDLPCESRRVAFFGPENDVAALDIRLRILQSEGLIECAERVHLDQVVASNVDATEHRDDYWHSRIQPFATRLSPRLTAGDGRL